MESEHVVIPDTFVPATLPPRADDEAAPAAVPTYGQLIYPQPEPDPDTDAKVARLVAADSRPPRTRPFVLCNALIVTRRELHDSLRDLRVLGPIFTLTLFFPLLAAFGIALSAGFLTQFSVEIYANRLVPFSVLAVGFFPTSFSLVVALEAYIGEKERNTLEALFSSPLTDAEMYVGKLIASAVPPVFASLLGQSFYLLLINTIIPLQTSGLTPTLLTQFMLLTITEAIMMVTAALMVSAQSTSVRGANLLASFIILPTSIIVQFEAVIMLYGQLTVLWLLWVALLAVTVLVLRAGLRTFSRESILTREADRANFRAGVAGLWNFARRTPQESLAGQRTNLSRLTPARIYRRDIPQIFRLARGGVATVVITLVVGTLVAYMFAQDTGVENAVAEALAAASKKDEATPTPTITTTPAVSATPAVTTTATTPSPIATPSPTTSKQSDGQKLLGVSEISTGSIFFNNVRAVMVGAIASLFCLGIIALLAALINGLIIGGVVGRYAYVGASPWLLILGYLAPHGIIELPMIVLGLGMGVYLGLALIAPPRNFSIGQSLQFALINWIKMLVFVIVPLLLVAAFIEANLTRSFGDWLFSLTGQTL